MTQLTPEPISVIIATLGRPELLRLCLESLSRQTLPVTEVIVVHCGDDDETQTLVNDVTWRQRGMTVRYFHYQERNCARQRNFAIERATYDNLLLVDDDIEVEPEWAEELFKPIWSDPSVAATMGRLVNQPMASPTFLWRLYRVVIHGRRKGLGPGRMVGAALPNGFPVNAQSPIACEWIGGGASAVRRKAFVSAGGFASFFTGSSPGEDLDLGYRLSRNWKVYYIPSARCVHHQAASGRETTDYHQYLSMRSRFGILTATMGKSRVVALGHIALWAFVQCLSEIAGLRRGLRPDLLRAWLGRARGFLSCLRWVPGH
ncbi:MAG TPA: glycosyltransferase family 2 protein [Pyrinomonadaceae bacterium]|nr:glycosyltransferase family 2 protein [Pyrinomonadaceae bacterium]